MSTAVETDRRAVAELLLSEWRMFERVTLIPSPGGEGFEAAIELNSTLVRGAVEQQGLGGTPATMAKAEARRSRAIAECVERVNAGLPASSRIAGYRLIG